MVSFLGSYERPRRQPLGETSRIGRLVRLSEDTLTAVVELGNEQFELPVSPGKYVLGANVAVLESKGKPRRVSGPAGVWPEGLDADAGAPDTVTAVEQLGPVEFSPEDQAILDQTVADLEDAQVELAKANTLLTTLGVAEDEAAITQALADYLDIPASEVTWSGTMYQTVLARLVVATGIVTEDMIATGSITSSKINVTYVDPESGYGFSLQPEGLTILDESGSPVIALRADMANYFTIMREGAVVASISPNGDIAGRSVSAAESLRYRGEEMADLLEIPARGVLARSTNLGQGNMTVGTNPARVAALSLTTPTTNRNIRISFEGRIVASTMPQSPVFYLRQAANPYVTWLNSAVREWWDVVDRSGRVDLSWTTTVDELGWTYGTQISVGFFAQARGTATMQFLASDLQQLVIEDLGPVVSAQQHPPYVPAGGGGVPMGVQQQHLWREQVVQVQASWVQTYRSDGTKPVLNVGGLDMAQRRAYQGYTNSVSGVIGFPSVVAELSGATIKRVRLWIRNSNTQRTEGATARISLHGYTSRPATHSWSTDVPIMEVPFIRGESQVIDIPAQYHAGVQSGLYRGVVFSASELGTQYAGVWDGENALWEIIYDK